MEVPSLVRNVLGGEEIEASVNLGDEDTVYLTGSRTLLYRAEGLLSDEKVEEFTHDVERLDVKEGRRKTKFVLEYVDGTETFTVPGNRAGPVLELLLTGVLRAADVTAPDETLAGVFRFSELAVIVTETSVVKHIGADVWTDDYEVYAFADLTHLSFDRGSVATEIVIEIDGHPRRIKTPNDDARKVQQVLEKAVFHYYGVSSLEQLNAEIAPTEDAGDAGGTARQSRSDIEIGDGIDPLVTDSDESDGEQSGATQSTQSQPSSTQSRTAQSDAATANAATSQSGSGSSRSSQQTSGSEPQSSSQSTQQTSTQADVAALKTQLDELTAVVERQNELLESQQETIDQLIAELREGRA